MSKPDLRASFVFKSIVKQSAINLALLKALRSTIEATPVGDAKTALQEQFDAILNLQQELVDSIDEELKRIEEA